MPYRNVCRSGRSSGGRVRQDDISIAHDILNLMPEAERLQLIALRRVNPLEFRRRIQEYRAAHRDQVRQIIEAHNAGDASPGILRFIEQVIRNTPAINVPPKPANFPANVRVQTHPGRHNADVHFEGRAADVFFSFHDSGKRVFGDWLFDYCVANCERYRIQGVIYGTRQWFSEMNGGRIFARTQGDHNDHVHIELNCDGANLR